MARLEQALASAREGVSVTRVFGPPVDREGVTLITVAASVGGGGGGDSPKSGVGGGFGGVVLPLGVYEIRDGQVRFRPSFGLIEVAVSVAIVVPTLARAFRRQS